MVAGRPTYRGAPAYLWAHGSSSSCVRFSSFRGYSANANSEPNSRPPRNKGEVMKEHAVAALQSAAQLGHRWGQRSAQTASATVNHWWERYEGFVGLNEVRDAQTKVTEAESAFMVSRGMVSDAHSSLEALQVRLKEVRARLDRVSREEAHYLELATLEHRLLQEERRLRTAYEHAESSEREKFALFSAAVRESHEKERTRAERTKNWSVIGSVLGALIGVMGSTYINRIRLQELKSLLLEAQKGPENLQEALKVQAGNHRSQQEELRSLINSLRNAVSATFSASAADAPGPSPSPSPGPSPSDPSPGPGPVVSVSALSELTESSRRTETTLESLKPQLEHLERGLGGVQGELLTVQKLLEAKREPLTSAQNPELRETPAGCDLKGTEMALRSLEETQSMLGERLRTNTVYSAAFSYSAAAITVCGVYLLLRGPA